MSSLIFSPGFYTKVRIDDEGNIVDVDNLTKDDLPQHSHSISDLDKTELTDVIAEVLSTFFANNGDCAVKFTYDKNTKTVSADVDIDEDSIQKNEYGQLISSTGGSTGFTRSVSVDDVSDISNQLETFRESIPDLVLQSMSQIFANNQNAAVVFEWDKETKTFSADLRYDGISINKDENGDLVATGSVPGDGGNCASHTHTADQIEDLEDFVVNIFNNYSQSIDINLANLIDGETIKINEFGQLVAVRTALERHTHTISEIIDYVPPEPAAKQAMSDLGEEVEYDLGVIDFSKLNIGYSILALSQYLKDVVGASITDLTKRLNSVTTAGDNPGVATLSVHPNAIRNSLYDKSTSNYRDVYYAPSVYLRLDYLPYDFGTVVLLVDGASVASADVEDLVYVDQSVGIFKVEKRYMKNSYVARVLKIDVHKFLEKDGIYEFQVRFHQDKESTDSTNTVTLATTVAEKLNYVAKDTSATHELNSTTFYDFGKTKTYEVIVQGFDNYRFVPYRMHLGKLEGSAEKSFILTLPNLWYDTDVEVSFEHQVEYTSCPLAKLVTKVLGGAIINDVLTPDGTCWAYLTIPNSEFANAIQIFGDVDIKLFTIKKGDLTAHGSALLEPGEKGGRLPLRNSKIISFADSYDPGEDPITVVITTDDTVDLSRISFDCLTI